MRLTNYINRLAEYLWERIELSRDRRRQTLKRKEAMRLERLALEAMSGGNVEEAERLNGLARRYREAEGAR